LIPAITSACVLTVASKSERAPTPARSAGPTSRPSKGSGEETRFDLIKPRVEIEIDYEYSEESSRPKELKVLLRGRGGRESITGDWSSGMIPV
jgi:hypothetical protein